MFSFSGYEQLNGWISSIDQYSMICGHCTDSKPLPYIWSRHQQRCRRSAHRTDRAHNHKCQPEWERWKRITSIIAFRANSSIKLHSFFHASRSVPYIVMLCDDVLLDIISSSKAPGDGKQKSELERFRRVIMSCTDAMLDLMCKGLHSCDSIVWESWKFPPI